MFSQASVIQSTIGLMATRSLLIFVTTGRYASYWNVFLFINVNKTAYNTVKVLNNKFCLNQTFYLVKTCEYTQYKRRNVQGVK